MHITPDNKLKKLIVIGDRVLIKPTKPDERTVSGLYLPPGVQEKKNGSRDYVIPFEMIPRAEIFPNLRDAFQSNPVSLTIYARYQRVHSVCK